MNQKNNNEDIERPMVAEFEQIQQSYCLSNLSQERLQEKSILPLRASPVLASLCGHLIGDGSLKLTNKNQGSIRFYGKKEKLLSIAQDYQSLFGRKVELTKRKRNKEKEEFKILFYDTHIARILAYIGVPTGDKIISAFQVPLWIREGGKEIKRAFLQAICDDELGGVYRVKRNTWLGLRFKMSKKKELIAEHLIFLEQLRDLLKEFGIETSKVKVVPNQAFSRKDGNVSFPAYFKIMNAKPNRLKFYNEIGFILETKKKERLKASLN